MNLKLKFLFFLVPVMYCMFFVYIIFKFSPIPQVNFGHDIFLIFDGIVRTANDQKPNADFYSPIGPAFYHLISKGYQVSGTLLASIPATSLLVSLAALTLGAILTRRSLRGSQFSIFYLLIFTIGQSPFQVFMPAEQLTFACIYNRWGFALLGVLMGAFFLEPMPQRTSDRKWAGIELFLTALLTAWLMLFKISYGIVALIIGLCSICILSKWQKEIEKTAFFRICLFCSALVFSVLILSLVIDIDLIAYLEDLKIAFHSRTPHSSDDFISRLNWLVTRNEIDGQLFVGLILSSFFRASRKSSARLFGSALLVLLVSGLTDLTNAPTMDSTQRETPVLAIGSLLICLDLKRQRGAWNTLFGIAQLGFLLAIVAPIFTKSVISLQVLTRQNEVVGSFESERFKDGELSGLVIKNFGGDPMLNMTYVQKVEDGVNLLVKNGYGRTPVLALDFTNPLNVARSLPSPRGAPPFLQYGFNFNENVAPTPERLFKDASVLMIPKHFGDGHYMSMPSLGYHYKKYVEICFRLKDQSTEWLLFVRFC